MPLNLLIAYPYAKKNLLELLQKVPSQERRLIVDSGAFTAWNTGTTIELDDYCRFLDGIGPLRPLNAVQLDVFGDPEGTYKNYRKMKERGYDVMPVFTRGDTKERLDEFYEDTDYIMFGGITVGGRNQNYMKWFLRNNGGRKAHWLGFCRLDFIKAYKPHSVDSSSWTAGARFGSTSLYSGGGLLRYTRENARRMPPEAVFLAAQKIGVHRHELLLLQKDDAWVGMGNAAGYEMLHKGVLSVRSLACTLSAISYVMLSHECERVLGTRYYLAFGNDQQLQLLLGARAFLRARKVIP